MGSKNDWMNPMDFDVVQIAGLVVYWNSCFISRLVYSQSSFSRSGNETSKASCPLS